MQVCRKVLPNQMSERVVGWNGDQSFDLLPLPCNGGVRYLSLYHELVIVLDTIRSSAHRPKGDIGIINLSHPIAHHHLEQTMQILRSTNQLSCCQAEEDAHSLDECRSCVTPIWLCGLLQTRLSKV